eukprot:3711972-Heterocapsa_arctica.AAC.1
MAEDEEGQEDTEAKGGGSTDGIKKYMMTEETVNIMVTMVTADLMKKVENMEEKLGEIEVTQEATKQITHIGFKDMERSLLAEHVYVRDKFGMLEDDIRGVKHLVKDLNNKRKSSEVDEDSGFR